PYAKPSSFLADPRSLSPRARIEGKVFARNARGPGKARERSRRAADPSAGFQSFAPHERSRRRKDAARVRSGLIPRFAFRAPRSKDLAHSHSCWPSDDFSALFGAYDSLGEGIQRDVLGEKLLQDGAKNENPNADESGLVECHGDLQAAGESNRTGS